MFALSLKRAVGSSSSRAFIAKRLLPGVYYQSTTPATVDGASVFPTSPEEVKLLKQFENPEQIQSTKEYEDYLANVVQCNNVFYGPERDFKNFPTPKRINEETAMKFKIVPQGWFDMFYNKTGVTGPYILFTGAMCYLLSKEVLLVDMYLVELLAFPVSFSLLVNKFGKGWGIIDYLDSTIKAREDDYYNNPIKKAKQNTEDVIEHYKNEMVSLKEENFIDDVYQENVGLMLEAEYRRRIEQVHSAFKKRLDFQLDLQNTKRRFEQDHMANWITSNVMKNITPQLEKESIRSCIETLKNLSKTAHATA